MIILLVIVCLAGWMAGVHEVERHVDAPTQVRLAPSATLPAVGACAVKLALLNPACRQSKDLMLAYANRNSEFNARPCP